MNKWKSHIRENSAEKYFSERRAHTCILGVWICAASVSIPLLVYRKQHHRTWYDHVEVWCDDEWPTRLSRDPLTQVSILSQIKANFSFNNSSRHEYGTHEK